MVVGAFDEAEFGRERLRLQPGDVLLLYTDGATEARAPHQAGEAGDLYGEERLLSSVEKASARGVSHANGLVEAVVADIDGYAGGQLRDDLAVLAIQVLPIPALVPAGREPHAVAIPEQIGPAQV
jgi:serine phosphatase RsbU (regulator of sigma subunit)